MADQAGAVAGGAAQLVAHAATKALLFLVAGAWLTALGTKQLDALRGAARRWPLMGVLFAIGCLSLAGIAPLSLWATKDQVLAAAGVNSTALYVVGLAAAAMSAAYAGKALAIAWSSPVEDPAYDTEAIGTRRVASWQQAPLVPLAAGAAVLGMLVLPTMMQPITDAVGLPAPPSPGAVELAVSAVLALIVLRLAVRFSMPAPAWAARWLALDQCAHTLVVRPILATAAMLARFDDRVIDRAVHGAASTVSTAAQRLAHIDSRSIDGEVGSVAAATTRTGERLARIDTRFVDGAVEDVARGARGLGTLARKTQTGQVHHYYVHAVVVLAAAVLFVLIVR